MSMDQMKDFVRRENRHRQAFLIRLYLLAAEAPQAYFRVNCVGDDLGLSDVESDRVARYLDGQGHAERRGENIRILHAGIVAAEHDTKE